MNEVLFLGQALLIFFLTSLWVRVGKEALFVWMGFLACLANFFVTKQITLFGLQVTASDVYMIGLFFSLNVIQEYWGQGEGKRAVKYALILQLGFLALSQIHLWLIPNSFDTSQQAFERIFGLYPRVLFASVATLWIVQQWDLFFFNFLKKGFTSLSFTYRNGLTLVVSQALDTALFSVLGLWGEVGSLTDIMLMSFIIKCGLIGTTSFLVLFLALKPKVV